jgi:hypothetical protein
MRRSSGDGDAGSGARQSHLVGIGVPCGGLIMKVYGCCLSHSIVPSSGPPIRRFSQRSPRGLVAGQMLLRPRNLLGVRLSASRIKKPSLESVPSFGPIKRGRSERNFLNNPIFHNRDCKSVSPRQVAARRYYLHEVKRGLAWH